MVGTRKGTPSRPAGREAKDEIAGNSKAMSKEASKSDEGDTTPIAELSEPPNGRSGRRRQMSKKMQEWMEGKQQKRKRSAGSPAASSPKRRQRAVASEPDVIVEGNATDAAILQGVMSESEVVVDGETEQYEEVIKFTNQSDVVSGMTEVEVNIAPGASEGLEAGLEAGPAVEIGDESAIEIGGENLIHIVEYEPANVYSLPEDTSVDPPQSLDHIGISDSQSEISAKEALVTEETDSSNVEHVGMVTDVSDQSREHSGVTVVTDAIAQSDMGALDVMVSDSVNQSDLNTHIGVVTEQVDQSAVSAHSLITKEVEAVEIISTEMMSAQEDDLISPGPGSQLKTGDGQQVGIMLANTDTVTQALLESFIAENTKPSVSSVERSLSGQRQHHLAPNIRLTEQVQIDENGKKQTVVYLSTDDTNVATHETTQTSYHMETEPHEKTLISSAAGQDSEELTEEVEEIVLEQNVEEKVLSTQNICTIAPVRQEEVVLEVYVDPAAAGSDKVQSVRVVNPYDYNEYLSGNAGLMGKLPSSSTTVEEIYSCMECDYTSEKRSNLIKHSKKHAERPHACVYPGCSYTAITYSNLKRHHLTHTDERRFPCPDCKLRFRQKIHLDKHHNYIHKEKTVKCEFCDYVCANRIPDLKLHMKRKHLKNDVEDPPTYLECDKCGFLAGSKQDLKQHFKFHKRGPELKLFCEHCSFVTDAKSRLERHRMVHTKEKPYECGIGSCDYRASQKEHIKRHHRTKHRELEMAGIEGEPGEEISDTTASSTVVELTGTPHVVVEGRMFSSDELVTGSSVTEGAEEVTLSSANSPTTVDASNPHTDQASSVLEPGTQEGQASAESTALEGQQKPQAAQEEKIFDAPTCEAPPVPEPAQEVTSLLAAGDAGVITNEPGELIIHTSENSSTITTTRAYGGAPKPEEKTLVPPSRATKYEPPDYSLKPKSFACTHCTMKFVRLLSLYKHLHTQHTTLLPNTQDEKLTCVVCDFKAQSHKALLVHMRKHNSQDSVEDQDEPGMLYMCVLCKYMNSKRRNLYQHLKKKHKISILVKKDGTASCVVEPNAEVTVVASSQGQEVTEVVGLSDGLISEPSKVINIVDLANSLTHKHDISHLIQKVDISDTKPEQDAAEAIVDLATQSVVQEEVTPTTAILESDESGLGQLQISAQQLHSLSSGDFIEINGETYKVELHGEAMTAVLCEPTVEELVVRSDNALEPVSDLTVADETVTASGSEAAHEMVVSEMPAPIDDQASVVSAIGDSANDVTLLTSA